MLLRCCYAAENCNCSKTVSVLMKNRLNVLFTFVKLFTDCVVGIIKDNAGVDSKIVKGPEITVSVNGTLLRKVSCTHF